MAESTYDRDRLIALSDGIIAFSMTLMAVLVTLPDPTKVASADFAGELWSITFPQGIVFCYTFVIVAMYWAMHNKLMKEVIACNGKLAWINIFFLLGVVLLAITSAMFGDYGDNQLALTIFACNIAAVGVILVWMWLYALHKKFLRNSNLTKAERDYSLTVKLVTPIIFLLSIPVSLYSVTIAELSWLLILPIQLYLNKLDPSLEQKKKK